jgi:N-acetylmuramoyl-L-alanine amidase
MALALTCSFPLYWVLFGGGIFEEKVTLVVTQETSTVQPNIDGNYYPLQYTEQDLFYMTQALYYEAQGEPLECQEMVAHVIMTRVYDWHYLNTVKEVIWADKQFSYTHDGKSEHMNSDPDRYVAEVVARQVLSGASLDTTAGSLYYFNPDLADPDWQYDYTFVTKCGNHVFYKRKETRKWS